MEHLKTFEGLFDEAGIQDRVDLTKLSGHELAKQFRKYVQDNVSRLDISSLVSIADTEIYNKDGILKYNLYYEYDGYVAEDASIEWNYVDKNCEITYSIDLLEDNDLTEGQVAQFLNRSSEYYVNKTIECADQDQFLEEINKVLVECERLSTQARVDMDLL